jgi:hypothetical protein
MARTLFLWYSLIGAAFSAVQAPMYNNPDYYTPSNFFSKFNFNPEDDPTHGYVDYQSISQATTGDNPIAFTTSQYAQFGADSSSVVAANARGRKSVRLESTATYTRGMFVLDLRHMPGNSCGAWPAYWTFGADWPTNGEIDIIENVNFQNTDTYTLHTKGGAGGTCVITDPPASAQNGSYVSSNGGNCAVENSSGAEVNFVGCSQNSASSNTFGDNFNSIGGGVIVMQWTSTHINMWNFPRNNIPPSLQSTTTMPNKCEFGRPDATFYGCNWNTWMKSHQIVFTNTFCGDFAGADGVYPAGTAACPSSCTDQVGNNPSDYADSYWQVNSLSVWAENPAYSGSFDTPSCPLPSSSSSSSVSFPSLFKSI